MKKLFAAALIGCASVVVLVPAANAATTATFTVSATLTSACTIGAFSGPLAFGAVTAFVAPGNQSNTATVKCTRSLAAPTAAFDNAPTSGAGGGGGNGTGYGAATSTTPAGGGVLPNGLYYSLSGAFGAVTTGNAPNATTGLDGQDSDDRVLTVTGTMPAQAGTDTVTPAASHVRTLTISF